MSADLLNFPERLEVNLLDGNESKPIMRVASDCKVVYNMDPYSLTMPPTTDNALQQKRSVSTEIRCFEWRDLFSNNQTTGTFPFLVPGEEHFRFDEKFLGSKVQIRFVGHYLTSEKEEFKWYGMQNLEFTGR